MQIIVFSSLSELESLISTARFREFLIKRFKRTHFQELQALRSKPEVYSLACSLLAKSQAGISYCKSRKHFVIRPTIEGKRVFLGSSTDFDEAIDILKVYKQHRQAVLN